MAEAVKASIILRFASVTRSLLHDAHVAARLTGSDHARACLPRDN
jgi:hypothetical protein